MITLLEIKQALKAVHDLDDPGEGIKVLVESALLDVDDHGCTTMQAVISVDGELWASDVYTSPQEGVIERFEPYMVAPVTVIEYRRVR
jgi:hypothetical protein